MWISEPIPPNDEFADLKEIAKLNGFWSNGSPGIVVVKNPIRTHWSIQFDVYEDDFWVEVTSNGDVLRVGDVVTIGPLPGADGNSESMYVYNVNGNLIGLQRGEYDNKGFRFDHSRNHTIHSSSKLTGYTEEDFSVLGEYANQYIATHEFLHMVTPGRLRHVVDENNIMHENMDIQGKGLSYRPLRNPDGEEDQHQWSTISKQPL